MNPLRFLGLEKVMTTVRKSTIALMVLSLFVYASAVRAQEVGNTVRARQAVDLKVENQAVATAQQGDLLTVRKKNDQWLWVQTAEGKRGWLLSDQVEVVATPAAGAPARKPNAGQEPWLQSIGVLSGQNIYTTFAYIGAIADGYGNKAYTAKHVQQLMAEIVGMSKVSRDSLEKVRSSNIVEQDKAAIKDVIDILDLLSQEADALSRYVESRSDADFQAYEKARDDVWPKVQGMLDLK